MKNKKILLCMMGMFIVGTILTLLVKYNSKTYVMYDGAMLALTLDGTPVTSLPTDTSNYYVNIECDNGVGQYLPIQEDNYNMKIIIKNIEKDGVKCDVDFTTINDNNKNNYLLSSIVQNNATQISSENNSGGTDISYRYTGKQPNNFLWYNNELWRIIGLIPTCTSSGCTTSENLIKIIRSEVLGSYAYDAKSSGYTGTWGNNTLYTLLNSYYYGKENGNNSAYCYGYYDSEFQPVGKCDYSVIGISSDTSDYYGRMVKSVYWNTGAANDASTTNDVYKMETSKQTISGKIGLISASDYGYAGLYYDVSMNSTTFKNYAATNWMYEKGNIWTNNRKEGSSNTVLHLNTGGLSNSNAYYGKSVRPTLYLDSNVYVISGNGTETTPYIIGIL